MLDLGTLGGTSSWAYDINDSGQIVGNALRADGGMVGFLSTRDGPMTDLFSSGMMLQATAINNQGQVTGGTGPGPDAAGIHAAIWDGSGPALDLGTLGGSTAICRGINNIGQVTGYSTGRPFIADAHSACRDLGSLGGTGNGQAYAINDAGQVVGYASATAGSRAFLWSESAGMQNLGTLGSASIATSINNFGVVVGSSQTTAGSRAFVWRQSAGMVDLNSLIDSSSGWQLQSAYDINDSGQIVGYGDRNGLSHAFLLTPVPEPGSLILLGFGCCIALWRRQHR